MRRVLILGAGTAGTMLANHLADELDEGWTITIVDRDDDHHYQPGYLFIPFGTATAKRITKRRSRFLPSRVAFELFGGATI